MTYYVSGGTLNLTHGYLCSVQASLQSLSILGLPDIDAAHTPTLASSEGETVATAAVVRSFVDVLFETNPLDGQCDTRIHLSVQPLETIFDAVCIEPVFKNRLNEIRETIIDCL